MHVRVLGCCEVERGGKVSPLRHKAAELVGLLALRHAAVSRAELAAILWPEAYEPDARHNLRQTLLSLRNRLGEELLVVGPDEVSLAKELEVDLWQREAELQNNPSVRTIEDERLFLPGATGDWVAPARVDRDRRLIEAGIRMGQNCLATDPHQAIAYARAAVAREPDLESPRSLIVRAWLALGDIAAATREIDDYEASLSRLMGRRTQSRLRMMLAPQMPIDLSGLDYGSLSASERLRLVLAALPAMRHRPQAGRQALEAALLEAVNASKEDRSKAQSGLAYLSLTIGDVVAAEAHARQGLGFENISEGSRASAEVILSRVMARMNRLDEASRLAERARESGKRLDDPGLEAAALRALGTVRLFRLKLTEAEAMFREAIRLASATEDRELLTTIRYNLAFALLYAGRIDAAAEEIEGALQDAPSSAEPLLRMGLGRMRDAQGRRVEAVEAYTVAKERLRQGGDPFYLAQVVTYLGELALARGDLDDARQAFTEAIEIRRTIGDRLGLMTAYKGLGTVAHQSGRLGTAERNLREALRFSLEIGEPMAGANTRLALARVLADAGSGPEALAEAQRARRGIIALKAHGLTRDDTLSLEAADALIASLAPS